MPRVALNDQQRREKKIIALKGWVAAQMKLTGKRQADVAEALGISQPMVSQMLKAPKKGKKANPDPFSYGQVLTLCDLFDADDDERRKLLTM